MQQVLKLRLEEAKLNGQCYSELLHVCVIEQSVYRGVCLPLSSPAWALIW